MIPLTKSLELAFASVVYYRAKEELSSVFLTLPEKSYIRSFLSENCPAFYVSDAEIAVLFKSRQQKRFSKKKKKQSTQLSLY